MKRCKYHILSFLILAFLSYSCQTQKKVVTQVPTQDRDYVIEGNFNLFEMDHLGNIYTVSNDNVLKKYNSDFNLFFEYSVNRLGALSHLDVSNPQKLLLYYGDYQHIVFLDNTLSELKNLNLETLGFWDVEAVAISRENNIWLFDPVNNRILKIKDNGDLVLSSNEQWYNAFQELESPKLFEDEDRLYLFSSSQIFQFDNFGNILKRKILKSSRIQFLRDQFLYLNNDKIYSEKMQEELIEVKKPLIEQNYILDFNYQGGHFYLLDNHGIWQEKY